MKIKIGNKFYDSDKEPIMIILGEDEKELISQMGDQTKFCSAPHECSDEELEEFMKDCNEV